MIWKKGKKQLHVRSGPQEVFCEKALLEISQNLQNAEILLLEFNVAGIQDVKLLKKGFSTGVFM